MMKKSIFHNHTSAAHFLAVPAFALAGLFLACILVFAEDIIPGGEMTLKLANGDALALHDGHYKWLTSIIFKIAIWFSMIPFGIILLRNIKPIVPPEALKPWPTVLVLACTIIIILLVHVLPIGFLAKYMDVGISTKEHFRELLFGKLFSNAYCKSMIQYIIGFAVTMLFVVALYRLYAAADLSSFKGIDLKSALAKYERLNHFTEQIVGALAILLSTNIISSMFQHEAVASEQSSRYYSFTMIQGYGILYVFLLCIFYLPMRQRMLAAAHLIREQHVHFKDKQEINVDARDAFNQYLGLESNWKNQAKILIAILSPVLSSMLPKLFE